MLADRNKFAVHFVLDQNTQSDSDSGSWQKQQFAVHSVLDQNTQSDSYSASWQKQQFSASWQKQQFDDEMIMMSTLN